MICGQQPATVPNGWEAVGLPLCYVKFAPATVCENGHQHALLRVQIASIGASTTRRFFDDCDSVMPRIGTRRALIRCHKPPRMRADLS